MINFAVAAAAMLLSPDQSAPASAQAHEDRECRDDDGVDRCDEARQRRVRDLFGVRSIEEHRDAGDQVRRVFYVDGYGRDLLAIAFVRAAGREPTLSVHFPRVEGEAGPEPLTAPLPEAVWSEVLARSTHFHRELIPEPLPQPADPTLQTIEICGHSWLYTAEASDPVSSEDDLPRIRRRTESACEDGLTRAFANEAQRIALPLLPHCARLEPDHYRNAADQLAACAILSGDRMAAAEVFNRSEAFRLARIGNPLHELRDIFFASATVDWAGQRNGAEGPLRFWIRMVGERGAHLFSSNVQGVSATRVRLTGELMRSFRNASDAGLQYELAPVEMIWRSDQVGEFLVESATVGRWQRQGGR